MKEFFCTFCGHPFTEKDETGPGLYVCPDCGSTLSIAGNVYTLTAAEEQPAMKAYTTKEAAAILRRDSTTIRRLINENKLPAVRYNGRHFIFGSTINAILTGDQKALAAIWTTTIRTKTAAGETLIINTKDQSRAEALATLALDDKYTIEKLEENLFKVTQKAKEGTPKNA